MMMLVRMTVLVIMTMAVVMIVRVATPKAPQHSSGEPYDQDTG
ncbi:MAG: hypothetical protein QOG38_741 [Hyphomicrobiales bacterium]|nr:hypothetical protein [Hyphomicrobiales bacterium]